MATEIIKKIAFETVSGITFSTPSTSPVGANLTASYAKYGAVVNLNIHVKTTASMAVGSAGRIVFDCPASIPNPYIGAQTQELNNTAAMIYPGRTVRIQNNSSAAKASGAEFDVAFTFITAE